MLRGYENFEKADSTTLGPYLVWNEVNDDSEVIGRAARAVTTGGAANTSARALSSCSSSNNGARGRTTSLVVGAGSAIGIAARFQTSNNTYYSLIAVNGTDYFLEKVVAGVETQLTVTGNYTAAEGDVLRIEVQGSLVTGWINDVQVAQITDTSITQGVFTGEQWYRTNATDDWRFMWHEAYDLEDPPVQTPRSPFIGAPNRLLPLPLLLPGPSVTLVAVGIASDADSALAVGRSKVKTVGVATETDNALVVARSKVKTVGIATSTETALPVGRVKVKAIGVATDTSTALTVKWAPKIRQLGVASDTETALLVTHTKAKAVGIAPETDTALPVSRGVHIVPVGTATETDSAPAVGRVKARTLGIATDTETALAVRSAKVEVVGVASDTGTALPVTRVHSRTLGPGLESNTALPVAHAKARTLGVALEADLAFPVTPSKAKAVGFALEHDSALTVGVVRGTDAPWTVDLTVTPLGTADEQATDPYQATDSSSEPVLVSVTATGPSATMTTSDPYSVELP